MEVERLIELFILLLLLLEKYNISRVEWTTWIQTFWVLELLGITIFSVNSDSISVSPKFLKPE
jgi:hypothetical protein